MAFPVYDNIYLSAPLPLDARYLVSAEAELNSGNVYVSMQRFTLKEDALWLRLSTGWRKIPLDASITAGAPGKDGLAATIEIGSVQESATMKVENAGTTNAAKLNFFLMRGLPGKPGDPGESVAGPPGPKGDNFSIEHMGSFANRSLYDLFPEFTAYLVDELGHADHGCLYFKKAGDGLWSDPIPFKGEQGWALELGVVNVNENIVVHSAAKWVGGRGAEPFSLTEQAYYLGPNGFTTNLAEATNIKGSKGDPGPAGESVAGPPGKEGPQGKAGLSLYFAYADDAAGTNASVNYDELKTHISLIQAAAAPALGSFQIWNRFKGEQGQPGQDGADGQDGVDGKSIYFAYANASDGIGATWEYANHSFVSFLSAHVQPVDFTDFTVWLPLGGGGAVFPLYVADTAYSEGSDVRFLSEGKYLLFSRSNANPGLKIDPVTSTDNESGEWIQIGGAGSSAPAYVHPDTHPTSMITPVPSALLPWAATLNVYTGGAKEYDCRVLIDSAAKLAMILNLKKDAATPLPNGSQGTILLEQTLAGSNTIVLTTPAGSVGPFDAKLATSNTITIYGEAGQKHFIGWRMVAGVLKFTPDTHNS